jgi:putative tryptophan/tyrosine transport system substrate-binding protein
MKNLRLGATLATALAASVASAADVAVLKSADSPAWRPAIDSLRRAASSHSFTEYDLRGDRAEADRVVGSLKGQAVIVVAMGTLAAQAAREGAPELPLVFCMVQDPGRIGLLGTANVTGVSFAIPVKNQLAAFRLVNPRGVRVGVLYNEANVGPLVVEAQKAAPVVRLNLVAKAIASERDVPEALRSLLRGGDAVDALWVPPDPVLLGDESRRYVFSETLKAGKPVYSFSSALVSEGALVSNGPDIASIGEQAGDLVNRIAGGERGRIEMLVPRAELVVNKKIADKLKIEIPADALRAANKVF